VYFLDLFGSMLGSNWFKQLFNTFFRGVRAEKRSRASGETNHAGTRFACNARRQESEEGLFQPQLALLCFV